MESKIMQIFYGNDCLPYKDKERAVHYPIVGSAFQGASLTTDIRFYIGQIGGIDNTWVAVSKLPNGKVGSQILEIFYDEEVGEYYAELSLSSFYTQAKGDLYISLQGYNGGVQVSYNDETEVYEVYGTPVIQATGSVKIAINYATQPIDGDEFNGITVQELVAYISGKLDKNSGKYIKVVDNIANINTSTYKDYLQGGDIVFDIHNAYFVILSGDYPTLTYEKYELDLENLYAENVHTHSLSVYNFEDITDGGSTTLTYYIAYQISTALADYVSLATEQTISGHKTFTTTITANQGVNFGNGANVNMYNGYILNNRAKLFGIGTSSDNRTFYQFPYGSISGNTHGESNPYTIATEDYVQTYVSNYAYSKEEINSKLTSMLVYKGSLTVAQLNALAPTLGETQTGWFYNVSDSGTLTAGNVQVLAGDNVAWTGSSWDKLTMDLSAYNETFLAAGFLQASEIDSVPEVLTFDDNGDITNPNWTGDIDIDYMSPPITDISISQVPDTLHFDTTQNYDNMITDANWTGIMTITY